jgi:hypothetical protein
MPIDFLLPSLIIRRPRAKDLVELKVELKSDQPQNFATTKNG